MFITIFREMALKLSNNSHFKKTLSDMGLTAKKLHFDIRNPLENQSMCNWLSMLKPCNSDWAIQNVSLHSSPFLHLVPHPVQFFDSTKKQEVSWCHHILTLSILPDPTLPQIKKLSLKEGKWLTRHSRWWVGLLKQLVPQYRTDVFWQVL